MAFVSLFCKLYALTRVTIAFLPLHKPLNAHLPAVLSQGGDDFCDEWVYKNVSVVLVAGPLWGTVQAVDNEQGASIKICNSANREKFLELYWKPFRAGVSSDKQYCSNYEPVPVAFDYSTQATSGVEDNTISMLLVTICALFLTIEIV